MNACDLIFPMPRRVQVDERAVRPPKRVALYGENIPSWLVDRLAAALKTVGASLVSDATFAIRLVQGRVAMRGRFSDEQRSQAYRLELSGGCGVTVTAGSDAGLRHGVLTLCQIFEAAGAGASLHACTILDVSAFAVRGLHVDLAREFFPRPSYLRKLIDRMAELKYNTLWLYLENHFHAPGIEDLSPPGGMTPEEARAISAYGTERGIDVVPATNVLSHMEGFFRLERYGDFVDGSIRSYPVLTDRRAWPLVKQYLDALLDAFPSPNFHPGLDELLFTGAHPDAVRAIAKKGKATYFADFACKVIRYLQSKGKRVWIWDDMVLGKNIHRPEGFGDDYQKALDRIPKDVVMTHWYYWTNFDGVHGPIMERVGKSGRPFVVSPNSMGSKGDFGSLTGMREVNSYMARCGETYGAFGFVCTMWQYTEGCSYEACWPYNALAAAYAWGGSRVPISRAQKAMAFVTTGEANGLSDYLDSLDAIQKYLASWKLPPAALRHTLIKDGPHKLWRRFQSVLSPERRKTIRALLDAAGNAWRRIGLRDPALRDSQALHMTLVSTVLDVLDRFDAAWRSYHRAALIERNPGERKAFSLALSLSKRELRAAAKALEQYRDALTDLTNSTGHDPYDPYVLGEWAKQVDEIAPRIDQVAKAGIGLPWFEKLLQLPDVYRNSNLLQLTVCNKFMPLGQDNARNLVPPPVRWE
jgi:hypothetical protein